MKIKFKAKYTPEGEYNLTVSRYPNNRPALVLKALNGEPQSVLTVNLPQNPQRHDELFIKDYAENEGTLGALMATQLVLPPHRWVMSGFVQIPVCQLTKSGLDLVNAEPLMGTER
jgi:hypothetical protein